MQVNVPMHKSPTSFRHSRMNQAIGKFKVDEIVAICFSTSVLFYQFCIFYNCLNIFMNFREKKTATDNTVTRTWLQITKYQINIPSTIKWLRQWQLGY